MNSLPAPFASCSTLLEDGGGDMDSSSSLRYFLISTSTIDSLMLCRCSIRHKYHGTNIFSQIAGSGLLVRKNLNLMDRCTVSFNSVPRNSQNALLSSHSSNATIAMTTPSGITVFTA